MKNALSILLLVVIFTIPSCKQSNKFSKNIIGPVVIIYKTKKYYNNNVPVILSDDKLRIISYPDIRDIFIDDKFAKPIELNKGYLLDQRGISKNVAFLKYTYQEYSELKETPNYTVLFDLIIDKNPIKKMYNCGNITIDKKSIAKINENIDSNNLKVYTRIK